MSIRIDILTLFPEMFSGPFDASIVKRAKDKNLVEIRIRNLRDWATDNYKTVDDHPYGGGAGMVMKVDVIDRALSEIKNQDIDPSGQVQPRVILTKAAGTQFTQQIAQRLLGERHLIFIAGHYEGVDARVEEHLADEALTVGPYVLSGGESAIMVMVDSIVRLIPGVLGNEQSLTEESHNEEGVGEYPQFTRPPEYKGWKVPEILLSGNHKEIQKWRKENSRRV